MSTLSELLPHEFWREHEYVMPRFPTNKLRQTAAAKLAGQSVVTTYHWGGSKTPQRKWPGPHRNVTVWWVLDSGHMVGWNENPSHGWSFPVMREARPSAEGSGKA